MTKPTSMDGDWELSGVLPGAASRGGGMPVSTNLCTLRRVEVAEKH